MPFRYLGFGSNLISNPYIGITSTTSSATTLYYYQQNTQTSTSAYNNFALSGGLQQQLLLRQYQALGYGYQGLNEPMLQRVEEWAIPPPPPEAFFAPPIIGEAINRARELLLSHLTPAQRESFEKNRFFVIEGGKSKTKYRIRDTGHLVANIDVLFNNGSRKHGLCGHCAGHDIPLYDSLLAQKLMLETSEEEFLKIANFHH